MLPLLDVEMSELGNRTASKSLTSRSPSPSMVSFNPVRSWPDSMSTMPILIRSR